MGKTVSLTSLMKEVNGKFPLEFAVLFGSRARGDSLNSSDYDIIFVSDKFPKDIFKRMSSILDLWTYSGALEPICFTTKEFEEKLHQCNAIVWECLKDGKPLYGSKKFKRYQQILRSAILSGDITLKNNSQLKFNKPPEIIVETAGI